MQHVIVSVECLYSTVQFSGGGVDCMHHQGTTGQLQVADISLSGDWRVDCGESVRECCC